MNLAHTLLVAVVCASASACGIASQAPREEPAPASASRPEVLAPAEVRAPSVPACAGLPTREVRLARDVEPVLMSACSGEFCHRLTTPARSYAFLVNQASVECDDGRPLVTPGDPSRSYVVDKILGRNLCAGHPMPRGLENRLTGEEVATLTDWICEGAPND